MLKQIFFFFFKSSIKQIYLKINQPDLITAKDAFWARVIREHPINVYDRQQIKKSNCVFNSTCYYVLPRASSHTYSFTGVRHPKRNSLRKPVVEPIWKVISNDIRTGDDGTVIDLKYR